MACIRKRRGKWVLDYRDAFGVRRWETFDTRELADEGLARAIAAQRQGMSRPAVDPETTVETYAVRWLGLVAATLKPSSVVAYEGKLRVHVLPALGRLKVRQLSRGRIKALVAEKRASGLSPDSARLILATVRAMLNAAVDDNLILANPALGLGRVMRLSQPRGTRQEQLEAMDRDQLSRFLGAAVRVVPTFYPLFFVMARTGLRLGEALALRWEDFDGASREIRVGRALSSSDRKLYSPKSGKGRTVDLSVAVTDVLERRLAAGRAAGQW